MTSARFRVLALMAADLVTMAIVWAIGVNGYQWLGAGGYSSSDYWRIWPAGLVFVLINSFLRLYHGSVFYPSMPLSPIEEFRRLIGSSVAVHLLIIAVLGLSRDVEILSRVILGVSAVGVAILAQPMRDLMRVLLAKTKLGQIRVLFVGKGAHADALFERISASRHLGFQPIRFTGDNHDIVPFACANRIKILVTCQDTRIVREEMVELVQHFQQIVFLPEREVFPIAGARTVEIGAAGGIEMVNQRKLKGLQWEKRFTDSLLSILIGIFALPCFLIVPILIKLTSRGPVIYKAKRLGKGGRTIHVWKFRSMYADADKRLQALLDSDPALKAEFERDFKLKNDPRVTPLGKFLRKTSIDELPQLVNVLKGEMALVGPRPIVEREAAYYGAAYEIFSLVKPGITGLWQCSGRSDASYEQRVALDRYYVMNWSPWMDLWIVFHTVFAVLKMKGSY